jgi:hypothetical protein
MPDRYGYSITTQRALRADFWARHPFLQRRPGATQNAYPCDARVAWVDFVDTYARAGRISDRLAQRATL